LVFPIFMAPPSSWFTSTLGGEGTHVVRDDHRRSVTGRIPAPTRNSPSATISAARSMIGVHCCDSSRTNSPAQVAVELLPVNQRMTVPSVTAQPPVTPRCYVVGPSSQEGREVVMGGTGLEPVTPCL
jgi:hypothetical protein